MESKINQFGDKNIYVDKNYGQINISQIINKENVTIKKLLNGVPFPIQSIVGRSKELSNLKNQLKESNIVFVKGVGGIGKSSIVKQYVKNSIDAYSHICWLSLQTSIKNSIANDVLLQNNLLLKEKQISDDQQLLLEVINQMSNLSGKHLLVIDNLQNLDDFYQNLKLLRQLDWHIIITSRIKPKTGFPINEIAELSKDSAKILFYRYYSIEKNDSILEPILENIKYHTLLIELLAKVGNYQRLSLLNLRQELGESYLKASSLKIEIPIGEHLESTTDTNFEQNIYNYSTALYNLSNISLSKEDKHTTRLISILPSNKLYEVKELCEIFKANYETFNLSLQRISLIGLIEGNKNGYQIHKIVKYTILENTPAEIFECDQVISHIINNLSDSIGIKPDSFDSQIPEHDEIKFDKTPEGQVVAIFKIPEGLDYDKIKLHSKLVSLGKSLLNYFKIEKSEKLSILALRISDILYFTGNDGESMFYKFEFQIRLQEKSELLAHMLLEGTKMMRKMPWPHHYQKNIKYGKLALSIMQEIYGKEDLMTLEYLNNLAMAFSELGSYNTALDYMRTYHKILEELQTKNDSIELKIFLGISWKNLGANLMAAGRVNEAKVHTNTAVELLSKYLDKNNIHLINALNNQKAMNQTHE